MRLTLGGRQRKLWILVESEKVADGIGEVCGPDAPAKLLYRHPQRRAVAVKRVTPRRCLSPANFGPLQGQDVVDHSPASALEDR